MANYREIYPMNKRGVIIEIGALIIVALTTLGVYISASASQNLYVGDEDTHHFFNYYKCKDLVRNIPEDNIVIFNSKEDALSNQYNVTEGCV